MSIRIHNKEGWEKSFVLKWMGKKNVRIDTHCHEVQSHSFESIICISFAVSVTVKRSSEEESFKSFSKGLKLEKFLCNKSMHTLCECLRFLCYHNFQFLMKLKSFWCCGRNFSLQFSSSQERKVYWINNTWKRRWRKLCSVPC